MTDSESTVDGPHSPELPLGHQIREQRANRGWDQSRLAREAGISRTTLSQLENGRGPAPRPSTVGKVTQALGLPPAWWVEAGPEAAAFDRRTNPAVLELAEQHPAIFAGLADEDWDELHSVFGTGGALSEEGVLTQARRLKTRRELLRQLEVVLETHLAEAATAMIESLYQRVVVPSDSGQDRPSQ